MTLNTNPRPDRRREPFQLGLVEINGESFFANIHVTVETSTPLRDKQGCGRCLIRRADGPPSILGPLSQMIRFSHGHRRSVRSLGKWKAGGARAPPGKIELAQVSRCDGTRCHH